MIKLVQLRHGQSTWNRENRFTGWKDVDLSEQGCIEAREAGKALLVGGYAFDAAHTSVLKRAVRTLWLALDEMDLMWLPVHRHWRLNERHYGALEGLNKAQTAREHGAAQVRIWRRAYDAPPPPQAPDDPRYPGHDPRYRDLSAAEIPASESLKDTVARFLPYWHEVLAPACAAGEQGRGTAHRRGGGDRHGDVGLLGLGRGALAPPGARGRPPACPGPAARRRRREPTSTEAKAAEQARLPAPDHAARGLDPSLAVRPPAGHRDQAGSDRGRRPAAPGRHPDSRPTSVRARLRS